MRFHLKSIVAVFALMLAASPMAGAADLNFTIQQVGSNVVMTGSGSVNTAGLTSNGSADRAGSVNPSFSAFAMGSPSTVTDTFWASLTGTKPAIGTGSFTLASSGTGDSFGVVTLGNGGLYLPPTYISGANLSGQSTFASTTLSGLGLTTGSYTWTWGSGANAGSAIMTIGAVPEPSTYVLGAIATGVMAAVARRRKAARG
ncbi:MAG: PEP-CTERM sorting domain-containing protein [Planctomycetota bacterium]|nr:PEP-CTERM sorting domain-containing protein [Planctomycetota bacterium]